MIADRCFQNDLQLLNVMNPNPRMAQINHDLRYAICSYERKKREYLQLIKVE